MSLSTGRFPLLSIYFAQALLERLGVPVGRSAQSELADAVDVGRTIIRLEGKEFPTPVIFGEPAEPSPLGVIALEDALLAVDPVARRLTPVNSLCLNRRAKDDSHLIDEIPADKEGGVE